MRWFVQVLRHRWINEDAEVGELAWHLAHVAATHSAALNRADELESELGLDVRVIAQRSRRKVGDV